MKKSVFVFIILLSCLFPVFADSSKNIDVENLDTKKLKIIKTEFFDIIYPEISQQAAAVLVQNADNYYKELASYYKLNYDIRFTVTIYPNTDMMNANFAPFPYNRIILYDTMCSPELAVFSDRLLNVFKHELAHGITHNIRNKFWHGVNKIFGDAVSPGYLITTPAISEGAAVIEESRNGEGRLNSEYGNKHSVKQSIIENKKLNHGEFQGARDIFPTAVFYSFGAEFYNWLEKKYGSEKYVQFWYKCENFSGLTYFFIFKSVYGFSIKTALEEFYNEFNVPDVVANPAELDSVEYFLKDKKLHSYSYLVSGKNKIAYVNSDASGVFVCKKDDTLQNGYSKPKRIIKKTAIDSISLSNDGKYLCISYYSTNHLDYKTKTMIVDLETNQRFYIPETGILHGIVVTDGDKDYFVGLKTYSQFSSFKIYELHKNKAGKICDAVLVDSVKNKFNDVFFNLTDDGKGNFVFIHKQGLNAYISFYNINKKQLKQIPLSEIDEERIEIADFSVVPADSKESTDSSEDTQLVFSWAKKGTMPRLGIANVNETTTEIKFYSQDVSGGIFNPVKIDSEKIVYLGSFFEGKNIFVADITNEQFEKKVVQNKVVDLQNQNQDEIQKVDVAVLKDAKDFSLWNYHKKGVIVPLGLVNTYSVNEKKDSLDSLGSVLGITYFTSTPWMNPFVIASAGYNIFTNSWMLNAKVNNSLKGTKTGLFQYDIFGSVEFDTQGYKQTYEYVKLSSKISLPNCFNITFANNFNFFEGKESDFGDNAIFDFVKTFNFIPLNDKENMFIKNQAGVSVGQTFYTGIYEKAGFAVSAILDSVYCAEINSLANPEKFYNNAAVGSVFYIPKLLPISNSFDKCVNLPSSVSVELFPSSNYFAKVSASTLLSSKELQWSPNWFPVVYVNRFFSRITYDGYFSCGKNDSWAIAKIPYYIESFSDGTMKYYDELKLSLGLNLAPNIGTFTSFSGAATLDLKYRFFPEPDKKSFDISFGISL